ncbi:nucleotidyltransferase substrate-binding protein, HI0074 family [Citrifermentans bemidjiense Bem]|uniref:Nucleotidyltransferase substrate-binding protein, HI0074 family n=1 Tax=Citrifermentans bemidjiense (strain ATCC BAA-1014 / DSM 16622 / JCM 12645 / Bem) TaxID=404380 RepID=B5EHF1_CITBB|nr:HI0074 family nucleotidyltransferase substrate-binding subunit [Citrifermentans bemidjiense]ACH39687.2 nucleotidyltransferase substrate-binding protein, HI0074 family [Citrifermentans bemidjiense Bem]
MGDTITGYLKALGQLEKAISQPKDEYVRDSVIQRFEFIHELALKMLKLRLEQEYVFANTPRETMRASLQAGFIEDGNAWTDLQKMRNLTSHTYNEELAEEVYAFVVGEGVYLFQQLAQKTLLWKTND